MSESKQSYNIMRHEGIDDMDYIDEMGLNPDLAYTPEINEAIIEKVAAENYEAYLEKGVSPEDAKVMADSLASKARATVAKASPILKDKGY
tara:strand:- start:1103 stop:1375 length:273 start_codon:yes stop_codon:yes gene_type:complete